MSIATEIGFSSKTQAELEAMDIESLSLHIKSFESTMTALHGVQKQTLMDTTNNMAIKQEVVQTMLDMMVKGVMAENMAVTKKLDDSFKEVQGIIDSLVIKGDACATLAAKVKAEFDITKQTLAFKEQVAEGFHKDGEDVVLVVTTKAKH